LPNNTGASLVEKGTIFEKEVFDVLVDMGLSVTRSM